MGMAKVSSLGPYHFKQHRRLSQGSSAAQKRTQGSPRSEFVLSAMRASQERKTRNQDIARSAAWRLRLVNGFLRFCRRVGVKAGGRTWRYTCCLVSCACALLTYRKPEKLPGPESHEVQAQ